MKKILTVLFIALAVISAKNTFAAGNTNDTSWTNQFRVWSPYDHTPARSKQNTSAYYNKTYGHPNVSDSRITSMNIWACLYDGRDVSQGHSYTVGRDQVTKLYNVAVENYGSGVSTRIDAYSLSNGYLDGVWSPDSR